MLLRIIMLKKKNIILIPNGIDLGKFNPNVDVENLEFYKKK